MNIALFGIGIYLLVGAGTVFLALSTQLHEMGLDWGDIDLLQILMLVLAWPAFITIDIEYANSDPGTLKNARRMWGAFFLAVLAGLVSVILSYVLPGNLWKIPLAVEGVLFGASYYFSTRLPDRRRK
jgi:hypothetical protein